MASAASLIYTPLLSLVNQNQELLDRLKKAGVPQHEIDEILVKSQINLRSALRTKVKSLKSSSVVKPLTPKQIVKNIFGEFSDPIALADELFGYMVQHHESIPPDLNAGSEDTSAGFGIMMCHGKIYRDRTPPFLKSANIKWITTNIEERAQPDIIMDVFNKNGIGEIGFFEYVLETNCAGRADPVNFLNFLYNCRHIMTKDSKCIIPGDFFLRLYSDSHDGHIGDTNAYLAFRQRLLEQILTFCNFSMYDLVDRNGTAVPIPTQYRISISSSFYSVYRV